MTTAEIQSQITATAQQYGVDPALALAVAQKESGFNPNATSPPNKNGTVDYGVFQINSSNVQSLGLTDPLDPAQNITAGIQMLAQLQSKYGDNTANILAAYNAGPGAVSSGNIPASTQSYVSSVMSAIPNWSSALPADFTSPTDVSSYTTDTTGTTGPSMVSLAGFEIPTTVALGAAAVLGLAVLFALRD